MPRFHAAVIHPEQSVTYCGTVGEDHLQDACAMAALPSASRHIVEHPRHPGSIFVLREDGDLDWYQPVDNGAGGPGKPAARFAPGRTEAATPASQMSLLRGA